MEDKKKMPRPRPSRLQLHNTLIFLYFNYLYNIIYIVYILRYLFTLVFFNTIHLLIYVVNYNLSIFIYLHYYFLLHYLLIPKIFSVQLMQSTVIAGTIFKHPRARSEPSISGPTRFPEKEQTGTHKKKEGRFNPSGQVSMRQRRTDSVLVPRSNVHIHSVTLGESLESIKN